MDKKLTDKEIKKALEESISFDEPYESDFTLIRIEYIKNALDLINRLQAENVRLKDYVDTVEKEVDWYRDELRHSDKKVENKVYKKVFEKLNDKSIRSKAKVKGCGFLYVSVVTLHDINALKKELVGEDNGSE